MKTLYKLLLLMIIGFFTTTLMFLISPTNYKDTIAKEEKNITEEIKKPIITLKYDFNINDKIINPTTLLIDHISDSPVELDELPDMIFNATLIKDGQVIADNLSNIEVQSIRIPDSKTVISDENPLTTTLDLSKENLFLDEGSYQIKLRSNLIEDNSLNEILINFIYEPPYKYIKGNSDYPNGQMAIRLYFADKNNKRVIPITRFINRDYPLNKQIIYELQDKIKSDSFAKTIDEVNYCVYSKNTAYIDLPTENNFYNNKATSTTSYLSLIKSMYAMSEYLECDAVRFTLDNSKADTYFNNLSIETFIEKSDNPDVYLGYVIDGMAYLCDIKISDDDFDDDINTLAKNIFQYYSSKKPEDLISPISSKVELIDVKLNEKNLNLNFNSSFLESTDKKDLKELIIDSLACTYTSIENVDTISITIEGRPLTNYIENVDLSGHINPPEHINIESEILN